MREFEQEAEKRGRNKGVDEENKRCCDVVEKLVKSWNEEETKGKVSMLHLPSMRGAGIMAVLSIMRCTCGKCPGDPKEEST